MEPRIRTPRRAVMAAFTLNGAILGTWGSRIPAVVDFHSLTEAALGGLLLLMGIGALVAFPFAGRAADAYGAARLTRALALLLSISITFLGLAPNIIALSAAITCFGVLYGAMDVAMNSWAAEVEQYLGRSVMASFHAMWSIGAAVGAGGGFLSLEFGFSYLVQFVLVALTLGILLGPFIMTPWRSRIWSEKRAGPVYTLPKGPLIVVGIVAMAATLGEGAMAGWSAIFLNDVVGVDQSHAALGYAAYSTAMVAMRLSADGLVTRYGPALVVRVSGLFATTGLVLVVGFATMPLTIVGFIFMGVGYAAIIPLAFSRAAADPDIPAGEAIASIATLGHGSFMLGPFVIGLLAEMFSLRIAFGILAVLGLGIVIFAPVFQAGGSRDAKMG